MELHWIGVVLMSWIVCHKAYAVPDFSDSPYTATVAEDATTGVVIVTVTANAIGTLEFHKRLVLPHFYGWLDVDDVTGEVNLTADAELDYKTIPYMDLLITAYDSGDDEESAGDVYHIVRITITEANANSPVLPAYNWTVMDGAEAGTIIGTVTATDADETAANNVISSYAITDGNTGTTFTISATGELTVNTGKAVTQTTTMTGYSLTITATDSATAVGSTRRTGTGMVHIVINSSATSVSAGALVILSAVLKTLV